MGIFSEEKDIIIIVGRESYRNPFWKLGRISCSLRLLIDKRDQISLVVFTGGEDVHPSFYGGEHLGISAVNIKRDRHEIQIFEYCQKHNIKRLGICRGVQFLGVMAGGSMYQHVSDHAGVLHKITYPALNKEVIVNSLHHQLIKLPETGLPIAWSSDKLSRIYIGPDSLYAGPPEREIEAAIFPEINAMGVQFHPEMMPRRAPGRILFEEMVKDFIDLSIEIFTSKYVCGEKAKYDRKVQTATSG